MTAQSNTQRGGDENGGSTAMHTPRVVLRWLPALLCAARSFTPFLQLVTLTTITTL